MDAGKYSALDVLTNNGVTTVTINRPEARNAINAQLHHEFATIFGDLDADPDTDVIVLQGSGGSFCAGGDLKWLRSIAGDATKMIAGQRGDQRITEGILTLEKPIIAKVDGPAVGLGCSLALFCDFVIATERSTFADPHVSVGLVAGDGGALLWPQLIGYMRAKRYLLTGDSVKAREAASMGLITQCVSDADELDLVVSALVERMVKSAKFAVRFTKASVNAGLRQVSSAVVDRAIAFEGITMMTEDFAIALDAFVAKETPVFKGK
jgi:enoyl-CoA hydratase